MYYCNICSAKTIAKQHFSCKIHWTCPACYIKCTAHNNPNILKCPICRKQHSLLQDPAKHMYKYRKDFSYGWIIHTLLIFSFLFTFMPNLCNITYLYLKMKF